MLCLETAEHIGFEHAAEVVSNCARHADVILFSAAIPGQGGLHHVNEQLPEYWQHLFDEIGYEVVDYLRPLIWNDARVPKWYRQNMLLFVNRTAAPKLHLLQTRARQASVPLSRAHPELLLWQAQQASLAHAELEKERSVCDKIVSDLEHERASLNDKLDHRDKIVSELEHERASLNDKLDHRDKIVSELEHERASLNDKLDHRDKIVSELEHERASLNDNLVHLRQQRKDLQRALAERSAAIQHVERQGLELHALLEKYREEAIQHREFQDTRERHDATVAEMADRIRALQDALTTKETEIVGLKNHQAQEQQAREDVLRELAASKRNDLDENLPRKLTGWRWILPGRRKKLRRLIREYRLIAASPLFDSQWYLAKNPDVAVRREDPALHYLLHGGLEGRAPGPHFDGGAYLQVNPDVANSQSNPLLHYIQQGHKENRRITPVADGRSERYLDTYSELPPLT